MKKQSEYYDHVYRAVCKHCETNALPPTIRDICELSGINSTSVVNKYLDDLAHDGYITREKGKSRSIQLVRGKAIEYAPATLHDTLMALRALSLCESWNRDSVKALWDGLYNLNHELMWTQPETETQTEARRIALEVVERLFGVVDDLLPVKTV